MLFKRHRQALRKARIIAIRAFAFHRLMDWRRRARDAMVRRELALLAVRIAALDLADWSDADASTVSSRGVARACNWDRAITDLIDASSCSRTLKRLLRLPASREKAIACAAALTYFWANHRSGMSKMSDVKAREKLLFDAAFLDQRDRDTSTDAGYLFAKARLMLDAQALSDEPDWRPKQKQPSWIVSL